jgi:hypothetical protein
MVTILPSDFKDFLRLLNEKNVEYLLVGGYAVIYYGYPRTTGDIDIWIAQTTQNAKNADRHFRSELCRLLGRARNPYH